MTAKHTALALIAIAVPCFIAWALYADYARGGIDGLLRGIGVMTIGYLVGSSAVRFALWLRS